MYLIKFRKIVALILATVFLIGVPIATDSYDVKDKDNCLMNFSVLSDVHIEMNNSVSRKRFVSALYDVKNCETQNDALVFLGDNTMSGQVAENLLFNGLIDVIKPASSVYTAMGNHDTGNGAGEKVFEKRAAYFWNCFNSFHGTNVEAPYYYSQELDHAVFAFMASEADNSDMPTISKEQVDWLDGVLAKADEKGVPSFVFCHHPLDFIDENGAELLYVLMQHHNVFFINGHTHTNKIETRQWGNDTYKIIIPKCTDVPADGVQDDSGAGLQIEVYENEVVVRARRFCTSEWLGEYRYPIR